MHSDSDKDHARQMFVDFDDELRFWRGGYRTSCFYRPGIEFEDYEPALKLGINVFLRSHGRPFDELRDQLAESYQRTRDSSPLEWHEASAAAAAAWARMSEQLQARIDLHANRDPRPARPRTARPARTTPAGRVPVTPSTVPLPA